jgi:hypothetical protein
MSGPAQPLSIGDILHLAREEPQLLVEGLRSALRTGPPEQGPIVLPLRKGEAEGMRSPFDDAVQAGQFSSAGTPNFSRSAGVAN